MRNKHPLSGWLRRAAIGLFLLGLLVPKPCLAATPLPLITVQPLSQTVQLLGTVTFSVTVFSGTTLSYQWLKNTNNNTNNIGGATLGSYTITNVQATDAGNYAVKVSNAGGSVTSSFAILTVLLPPSIRTQPKSQTTTQGLNAAFSVVASGTPPFSHQWSFNGTPLSGATTSALALTNVQTTDAGSYTVVVTNPYGSATSAVAKLTVLVPPAITTQPQNQAVTKGQTASFAVEASGTPPLSYQWRFNGTNLSSATSSALTLSNVQSNQTGSYTVVVTNVAGSVKSAVATLTVYVPARIATQPSSQTATQGLNAAFSVVASGTAPFSYQWNFNGTDLTGATNSALALTNVQPTDAGGYTVVVTNSWGSITSAVAKLTVNTPPAITTQPLSQAVTVGQNASFSVVASGTATLSYQWYFNNSSLGTGATSSTLTLSGTGTNMAGNYTVAVNNSYGSVTSAVAILTVYVPPAITTQPLSQTVTQGLTASLSVVASGTPPLSYQWQYSGHNVDGATDTRLVLTNMQLVQAGNYSVTVSNVAGTAVSALALLTVIPPPGSDLPVMRDLVAHLTFDTDLTDSSGRGNHAAAVGAPNLVPGFIGAGSFNPFTQNGTNNYATLGTGSDFLFNTATDFSITFWARLSAGGWSGDPAYSDPAFISNKDWSSGNNHGWVVATGSDGRLQWNYTEAGNQKQKDFDGPAGAFGNPIWHHVAVTFQRTGNAITYWDGVPVSTNSIGPGTKSIDSALPTNIGNDGTGNYSTSFGYWTNAFGIPTNGLAMDDVGIWRRVLPAQEICAIYNVGLAGQDLATVTSTNLTLVVLPRIMQPPVSLEVIAGSNASFSVTANGTAPLSYQWSLNSTALSGATSSTLTLTNVQTTDAGNYTVVVTNVAGSVTSEVATLTVTNPAPPVPPSLSAPGMTTNGFTFQLSGSVGQTYVILATTNLQDWIPISTNVALIGYVVITDPSTTNYTRRFYRAMMQ